MVWKKNDNFDNFDYFIIWLQ